MFLAKIFFSSSWLKRFFPLFQGEGKRCLVLGGCGFLGRHIAEQLLERGYDVNIFDIRTTFENERINFFVGDLCDKNVRSFNYFNLNLIYWNVLGLWSKLNSKNGVNMYNDLIAFTISLIEHMSQTQLWLKGDFRIVYISECCTQLQIHSLSS